MQYNNIYFVVLWLAFLDKRSERGGLRLCSMLLFSLDTFSQIAELSFCFHVLNGAVGIVA